MINICYNSVAGYIISNVSNNKIKKREWYIIRHLLLKYLLIFLQVLEVFNDSLGGE